MPKSQSFTTTFWHIQRNVGSIGQFILPPMLPYTFPLETDSRTQCELSAMHAIDISNLIAISVEQSVIISDTDLEEVEEMRSD